MLTCKEFTEKLSDYLDGRMPFGEKVGFWFHSAMCVHCRCYMNQIRLVVGLAAETPELEDGAEHQCPEAMKQKLLEAYRAHQREE